MIGPEEFVYALSKDFGGRREGEVIQMSANNIGHYSDWFNRLTLLVATDVCKVT